MEVCTAGAPVAPDGHPGRALALLRRFGVVVGLLFGLGLVALFVADRAAADDRGGSADVAVQKAGGLGRLTEPLTGPVADGVVRPLADAVAPVVPVVAAVVQPVAPVVRAGADVLAPVVRPVAEAVAPVTAPLLRPVAEAVEQVLDPVLRAAAPVTGPLLTPVLDAAKPVVTPVADATGLAEVTDAVSGTGSQGTSAPVERSLPAPVAVPRLAPQAVPVTQVVREVISRAAVSSVVPVATSGSEMAPGSPGPQPGLPTAPVPFAVTGGGAAGGTSGPHGGDSAVVGFAGGVVGQWPSSGRSPPGTIVGAAWFGYDDRDHPS